MNRCAVFQDASNDGASLDVLLRDTNDRRWLAGPAPALPSTGATPIGTTAKALRARHEDIPVLVEYFIDRYARKEGKTIRRVNKRTLDHLQSYPWPGNVRELQNVIERSVIVCDTDEFTVDESWLSTAPAVESPHALSSTLAGHEKAIVEDALRASGGRVFGPSGAAARLGIARSTLETKIRALGINKNRFRARAVKT